MLQMTVRTTSNSTAVDSPNNSTPFIAVIGPITALNGILLFGWSTAVIFEILRTSAGALRDLPTHS